MEVWKDKIFLRRLAVLALPIALQSFITSSLNLIDNMMVGRLGEASIAAVGLANQYIFIFSLAILGINAGASVFMAQFWGKRDLPQIKKVLGLDLVIGFIAALLFGLGAFFGGEWIMSILSKDTKVIELGTMYLKVVAISCIFNHFTQAYCSALRSTEQVKIPMYGSLIGVFTNAVLNWIFIFGKLGFAPMGVYGAALATTLARLVEMLYVLGYIHLSAQPIRATLKELMAFKTSFVKTYFKTSWSVIVNELVFSLGMTAYSVAYARIGTKAVATMQIATTLNNLFTVLLMGMASAAAIMIGNTIGRGDKKEAKASARKIGELTPILAIFLSIAIWLIAPLVVGLFNIEEDTFKAGVTVLRIMAVFLPIRAFNMVMIVGVFRGGGDTLYSMLVQSGTIWCYCVPLAFLGATVFGLPVELVYLLICTEECIKLVFELKRLQSGKWIHEVV